MANDQNIVQRAVRWIEDQVLTFIQRRCEHPDEMVALDILEGTYNEVAVRYCRRCGAVKPTLGREWRAPCPNLWRGR